MDEHSSNKLIGSMILAIIAFYILRMIVPFLICCVIGLVIWRVYQEHQKHK